MGKSIWENCGAVTTPSLESYQNASRGGVAMSIFLLTIHPIRTARPWSLCGSSRASRRRLHSYTCRDNCSQRVSCWQSVRTKYEDAYRRFLNNYGINFVTVRDPSGAIQHLYGTSQIPETYIIDRKGILRRRFVNSVDWNSPRGCAVPEQPLDRVSPGQQFGRGMERVTGGRCKRRPSWRGTGNTSS